MLINSLVLSLSSSIDSLGIGITYGIKNTKISILAKIVLLVISFTISVLSVWFGNIIKTIFPDFVTKLIGNIILIAMGIFVFHQAIRKNEMNFDLDFSNSIDGKEALFLRFALSLDCFCIGSCGSILGVHPFLFPLFISAFQLIFLSTGNLLGKKLHAFSHLPDNVWSILSGILLILIGVLRFIFSWTEKENTYLILEVCVLLFFIIPILINILSMCPNYVNTLYIFEIYPLVLIIDNDILPFQLYCLFLSKIRK